MLLRSTYELTKAGKTDRVLGWTSDESLDVRVQIKLLNNYPKYFEVTTCQDNNVTYFYDKETKFEMDRIFVDDPGTENLNGIHHIGFGHKSTYSECFDEEGTILKGEILTDEQKELIKQARYCAEAGDPKLLLECTKKMEDANIPTVKRTDGSKSGSSWMYSPEVER